MADERVLSPAIQDERFKAALEILDRVLEIDLSVLNLWKIDNIGISVLPHMADQLNVMGFRGWLLCTTEAQRRTLVANALELHRYAGTPWSIVQSICSVGYDDATVQENPPHYADGAYAGLPSDRFADGSTLGDGSALADGQTYGYSSGYANGLDYADGVLWGRFNINLRVGETKPFTSEQEVLVRKLVNEWKNARSHLAMILPYDPHYANGDNLADGNYPADGTKRRV